VSTLSLAVCVQSVPQPAVETPMPAFLI